jgi:hypothetical protein
MSAIHQVTCLGADSFMIRSSLLGVANGQPKRARRAKSFVDPPSANALTSEASRCEQREHTLP